jgi:cytochrome c5
MSTKHDPKDPVPGEESDVEPIGLFVPVLAVLAAVGLVMYLAYDWADRLASELHEPRGEIRAQRLAERIRPVGQVAISGQEAERPAEPGEPKAAQEPAAQAPPQELDGEAVYNTACVACHGAGIAGAPKTGDAEAWQPRIEQGMDTLVKHAIEGFQGEAGLMPARGGNSSLTDEQVHDAVQHMVEASGG